MKTRLLLPPATDADWRWREYKGYLAICGDCIDCEVIKGKVLPMAKVTPKARLPQPAFGQAQTRGRAA